MAATFYGVEVTIVNNSNYFLSDEDFDTLETNQISSNGLPALAGYEVELNPTGNKQLENIHGQTTGDLNTLVELVRLQIDNNEITADYNTGLTISNITSGNLEVSTAYIVKVIGTTDLSGFTDDTVILNEAIITKDTIVNPPTWAGGTELQKIYSINDYQTNLT